MAQLVKGGARLWSKSTRLKYIFLLATLFFGSFLIISITNRTEILLLNNDQPLASLEFHRYDIEQEERYTIKTEGCTIPFLIPLDESIKSFNKPPTGLRSCPNANYTLLLHNRTHIWVDMDMLQYYNVSLDDESFSCCYEAFHRPASIEDVFSITADNRARYEACVEFNNYIKVAHEFVRVRCVVDQRIFHKQYFLFARKKSKVSRGENMKLELKSPPSAPYYNVIVMGIDAISRLNFYRTMPKTLAYLKQKGAIELLGYNKVGDNTFPNLIPMLMGVKETDLKRICWPNHFANFDNCPFIWEWFREAGFYTALGEDSGYLSTFNFGKYGFIKSPTDYYLRTFIHEAEVNTGNTKDFNSLICMGNKYFFNVLLDYIEDLMATLRLSKLFGFFWEVTMSHDYLNYPMVMDNSYKSFLERLDKSNRLDNTVLILLSDHGIRWGPIRLTKQGRLEERLPFVHILLPPSFQENYSLAYENIKQNSKRLTTPFDIYTTLADLINLNAISDKNIQKRSKTSYALNRCISLFLPIPSNRTCKMADIDDHWCTCHKELKMLSESSEARNVGEQLVTNLNSILEEYPQCAELKLEQVLEVTEMVAGTPRKNEIGWREYMAVVRTSPGGGVFEGTLRYRDEKWSLSGSISRLNLYGDQSSCMLNYQLKLYCYCS